MAVEASPNHTKLLAHNVEGEQNLGQDKIYTSNRTSKGRLIHTRIIPVRDSPILSPCVEERNMYRLKRATRYQRDARVIFPFFQVVIATISAK